ncbi:KTSC domain-containing protein [Methyloligella sp. 2.7D]|uniref:KTSC domain-containing protein n=1 Tax=unclassified Methyloligella TaxID=2625955 RepID=UPI00157CA083|nr:KTSC domain-containing protein [Methyloligella sp. GL2]QKP77862.1 KTSC domain-containing protein [Methyloligella sp. GL2]
MPSDVIRAFFYDVADRSLTVRFQSGGLYVYDEVPEEVYRALAEAPSRGTYFKEHIRDHYPSRRYDEAG